MIKIKTIVSLVLAAVILTAPFTSFAQVTSGGEVPFGGLHLVTLDESVCTCSGNSHWILNYVNNSLLMLYYQAGQSVIFSNFNTRATYQLGSYSLSSMPCSILIGEYCYDLNNNGTYGMLPGTGTSLSKAGGENMSALFKQYQPSPITNSYVASLKKKLSF